MPRATGPGQGTGGSRHPCRTARRRTARTAPAPRTMAAAAPRVRVNRSRCPPAHGPADRPWGVRPSPPAIRRWSGREDGSAVPPRTTGTVRATPSPGAPRPAPAQGAGAAPRLTRLVPPESGNSQGCDPELRSSAADPRATPRHLVRAALRESAAFEKAAVGDPSSPYHFPPRAEGVLMYEDHATLSGRGSVLRKGKPWDRSSPRRRTRPGSWTPACGGMTRRRPGRAAGAAARRGAPDRRTGFSFGTSGSSNCRSPRPTCVAGSWVREGHTGDHGRHVRDARCSEDEPFRVAWGRWAECSTCSTAGHRGSSVFEGLDSSQGGRMSSRS